jgi:hypothetical protein
MTQPSIEFEIDFSQVEKHPLFAANMPKEMEAKVSKRLKELFITILARMEQEIIPTLPRGATGLLRQSYAGSEIRGKGLDIVGIFGSTISYAPFVEEGTQPHFPPSSALVLWVRRRLGIGFPRADSVAYMIARAISFRGTKAQKQVATWLAKNEKRVLDKWIIAGLDDIWEEMVQG